MAATVLADMKARERRALAAFLRLGTTTTGSLDTGDRYETKERAVRRLGLLGLVEDVGVRRRPAAVPGKSPGTPERLRRLTEAGRELARQMPEDELRAVGIAHRSGPQMICRVSDAQHELYKAEAAANGRDLTDDVLEGLELLRRRRQADREQAAAWDAAFDAADLAMRDDAENA